MKHGIEWRRCAQLFFLATSLMVLTSPLAAQQPTSAQRSAIREACRTDYEAHCANVPSGGKQALMCLQQNMANLSQGCQIAVGAVGKTTAAPPVAAPPASAAAPVAPPPLAAAPVAPSGTVGAVTAPPAPPMRAMTPRQEIALVRTSCGEDFRMYCGNVQMGGGRAVACLRANAASLSPTCQNALMGMRRSR